MKKMLILVAVGLLVFGVSRVALAGEKIVIAGTGDSQRLLRFLAKAFEKAHPGIQVEVPDSIGSGGGIRATVQEDCDLGRVARGIKEREKKYNLNYRVFAYSPIVFAVHPSVKGIDGLTLEQIVGIYTGRITSWRDLGGGQQKIYVIGREKGDSSRSVLQSLLAGWEDAEIIAARTVYSTPATIRAIASREDSIGYVPLNMLEGTDLIVLKIDGIYPSVENLQSGDYALVVSFGIVWKGELTGLSKEFVDFLFSSTGKEIIRERGNAIVQKER